MQIPITNGLILKQLSPQFDLTHSLPWTQCVQNIRPASASAATAAAGAELEFASTGAAAGPELEFASPVASVFVTAASSIYACRVYIN